MLKKTSELSITEYVILLILLHFKYKDFRDTELTKREIEKCIVTSSKYKKNFSSGLGNMFVDWEN